MPSFIQIQPQTGLLWARADFEKHMLSVTLISDLMSQCFRLTHWWRYTWPDGQGIILCRSDEDIIIQIHHSSSI